MSPAHRRMALLAALTLTAGLVLLDGAGNEEADSIAESVAAPARAADGETRPRARERRGDGHIPALRAREAAEEPPDSFAPRDWSPPPAVQSASAPEAPPAPSAPPVPFTVLGKQHDGGIWRVFLSIEDRLFVVKAGDMIDDNYRVDSVELPVLTLTYLPLKERQTLAIGEAE